MPDSTSRPSKNRKRNFPYVRDVIARALALALLYSLLIALYGGGGGGRRSTSVRFSPLPPTAAANGKETPLPDSPFLRSRSRSRSRTIVGDEVTIRLNITGMTCSSCVKQIEVSLMKQNGVSSALVNLMSARGEVKLSPSRITPEEVVQFINGLGHFEAELVPEAPEESGVLELIVRTLRDLSSLFFH